MELIWEGEILTHKADTYKHKVLLLMADPQESVTVQIKLGYGLR